MTELPELLYSTRQHILPFKSRCVDHFYHNLYRCRTDEALLIQASLGDLCASQMFYCVLFLNLNVGRISMQDGFTLPGSSAEVRYVTKHTVKALCRMFSSRSTVHFCDVQVLM